MHSAQHRPILTRYLSVFPGTSADRGSADEQKADRTVAHRGDQGSTGDPGGQGSADDLQNDPRMMQFFDYEENWGQFDVVVGRPWSLPELRQKSNYDLHVLWYMMYKEKNMLLTMQRAYKDKHHFFPSPERIYKVEESMENLEKVVSERNQTFLQLETGESGERPHRTVTTFLGFKDKKYLTEHATPPPAGEEMSPQDYERPLLTEEEHMFQRAWREQKHLEQRDREDDLKRRKGEHKLGFQF